MRHTLHIQCFYNGIQRVTVVSEAPLSVQQIHFSSVVKTIHLNFHWRSRHSVMYVMYVAEIIFDI